MKNSRLIRGVALVAVSCLIASCGGGSESSDTTERTRNASTSWSATTTPTKMLVYGTQDGHVEALYVDEPLEPAIRITNVSGGTNWQNIIASVAVDTARSEVIFAGSDSTDSAFLTKMNLDGTGSQNIFTVPKSYVETMAYDPGSRLAITGYTRSGTPIHAIHSVDEVESPIVSSTAAGLATYVHDGSELFVATKEYVGLADSLAFRRFIQRSVSVGTPQDISSLAQDTQSALMYGGRHTQNQLLSFDTKGRGNNKVENFEQPSSVVVFSDGKVAVGRGASPYVDTPTYGGIQMIDPSGATSPLWVNYGTGATSAGVQSMWAVESPISTAAPTLSTDSAGNLVCSDATWRGDLPLSRLSRAPIASARSYGWFFNGTELVDESSETLVVEESGSYACAVIAANVAGVGNSALSNTLKVDASEITTTTSSTIATDGSDSSVATTTTTVSAVPGGSESSEGPSPVVTVPTVSPGTPIVVATPSLRSAKWTFKGRTAKVTFRKWSGASKYRLIVTGATKKTVTCKTVKTTVTCTATLKKGINSFSAKAMSRSGITLALSTKTRNIK